MVDRQHAGQSVQRQLGTVAMSAFAIFVVIVAAFHFIQPDLDPARRFASEYSAGRLGWLMKSAFFCFSAGLAAMATAIGFTARLSSRSRAAGFLLLIASTGIFLSGLFNADLQGAEMTRTGVAHDLAGFATFLTLLPAMFVVSRRIRNDNAEKAPYSTVRVLAWTSLILFLAMLFYFDSIGLIGVGQRIFLLSLFAWLIITARLVRAGVLFRAD